MRHQESCEPEDYDYIQPAFKKSVLFQEFSKAFSFEYGFQEEVQRKCDYGGCENVGKVLCEDCDCSLCDICFEKGKGRAICSDTKKCGDCDERVDERVLLVKAKNDDRDNDREDDTYVPIEINQECRKDGRVSMNGPWITGAFDLRCR